MIERRVQRADEDLSGAAFGGSTSIPCFECKQGLLMVSGSGLDCNFWCSKCDYHLRYFKRETDK
jgi:hypothetical protein